VKKILVLFIIPLLLSCSAIKKPPIDSRYEFSIVYYDVENMKDTINNSGIDDEAFTPHGELAWNTTKYERKVTDIATVLDSINQAFPSTKGIFILREVENIEVARELMRKSAILHSNNQFQPVYYPSGQNANCVIFYNSRLFHTVKTNSFVIDNSNALLLSFKVYTPEDSLRVLIIEEDIKSSQQNIILEDYPDLNLVLRYISLKFNKNEKIVLAGRFNPAYSLQEVRTIEGHNYQNPLYWAATKGQGTIHQNGKWLLTDQFWANQALSNAKKGIHLSYKSGKTYQAEFLLKENPKADAAIPFPTYGGPNYFGGISNHLPVIIELETSN